MAKSASIQAIELTRSVFESIQGGLGLLKFSVESLIPTNGKGTEESKKWDVVCSLFESLGSSRPSRYLASVDLNKKTIIIKKLDGGDSKIEGAYKIEKQDKNKK